MIRRVLAAAVLGAALFTAACADPPADAPDPTAAPTSAAAASGEGDKVACDTFSAAATAMGGQIQGSMAELTAAMSGDKSKLDDVMKVFAKAYTDFGAGTKVAEGQATNAELKDALGKMATITETGAKMFADPKAADDSQAILGALTGPEISAAQQTVLTHCAAYMK